MSARFKEFLEIISARYKEFLEIMSARFKEFLEIMSARFKEFLLVKDSCINNYQGLIYVEIWITYWMWYKHPIWFRNRKTNERVIDI